MSDGAIERVGVEGTSTYGAALSRHLRSAGIEVVEVDRPDRKAQRAKGKSDPLDAYSAARAALAGRATGSPKARDGRAEAIRALRVARSSAVKARSHTNQLKALLVTAPAEPRGLSTTPLITACARLRPAGDFADPEQATRPRCAAWPVATSSCPKRSATPTPSSAPCDSGRAAPNRAARRRH